MITKTQTISQAILELCDIYYGRFGYEYAYEINNGNCENFASDLESMGFGKAIWGESICTMRWSNSVIELEGWFTRHTPSHCFIVLNNKFYDSECPDGCDYPDQLPYYQRCMEDYYDKRK